VTRYVDLFTTFYSLYNSFMKVAYTLSTASIIYTIRFQEPIKSTYNKSRDNFPHWKYAVLPCAILGITTHLVGLRRPYNSFDGFELLWTFSIYLESIAIVPQLIVLQRYAEVENLTGNFVFCLGVYSALYIANWIYRAHNEPHYRHHWVVYVCGVLQTLLYVDFFYYYCKSRFSGNKLKLPTPPGYNYEDDEEDDEFDRSDFGVIPNVHLLDDVEFSSTLLPLSEDLQERFATSYEPPHSEDD
jgi:ER lumen protein retaining receptor